MGGEAVGGVEMGTPPMSLSEFQKSILATVKRLCHHSIVEVVPFGQIASEYQPKDLLTLIEQLLVLCELGLLIQSDGLIFSLSEKGNEAAGLVER
ncbi:hypothetical protein [Dyella sp. 2HG41-7]|uniref:hypothetical protein n=1 Tax=Dyella sp. 2HG41-7 TaxID=2883239 RepID=UPI001F270E93|nr:hypothetical protein [Dyella sp. 2HG41-7]